MSSQTTDAAGNAAFTLATPLVAGSLVCVYQTVTPNSALKRLPVADPQTPDGSSPPTAVTSATDWGLIRAYFTGGIVIANDNSNFSSAHQFFALNVDKTWIMPRCPACASASPTTPSSGPAALTVAAGTTQLTVGSGSRYEVWGKHIKVLGATLNGNSLNAINPLAGIVVSGEFLKVVHDIAPGNQTIIHVSGTISITVSGGGAITYDANKMAKISNGAITLLKGGSLGIAGAATIAFQGSVPATDSPTHNPRIGISSFFDARLTAIPVSSNPTNTTTVTPTSSSDSANPEASTTTTSTSSPATTPSFLDTQKTARLSVGVYFPIPLTRWVWKGTNNALFLAPLAKIGFDTLTAATSQNVTLAGGGTGTESYQQLYNFRTFGARIGHMQYSGSPSQAPEVYSYLDIGVGPFSNLESLICHRTLYTPTVGTTPGSPLPGQMTADGYANNGCQGAYSSYYQTPSGPTSEVYEVYETRKRIYRLDFEGLLKIPGTVFYVGFNANLAQKAVGAGRYDPAFKAPDDLRFFFGTKFDISTLLSKLGVNLNN